MSDKKLYQSVLLTPEQVLNIWPQIEGSISDSLAHSVNELTTFEICKQALDGKIFIWLTLDDNNKIVCVTTTRFLHYKNTKVMQIITMAAIDAKLPDMFEQHETLERFAKDNGCSGIQAWGRKGWLRRLKPLRSSKDKSYELKYFVFHMEI